MRKILILIDNAYSYAGTENVCNFMTECYGENHHVDLLSLRGFGNTFYPYNKVKKIVSLDGVRFKFSKIINIVNSYDIVFTVGMGKLSFLVRWLVLPFIKKKVNFYACEHVSLNSFSKIVRFLKLEALRRYDNVIVLNNTESNTLMKYGIKSEVIGNPIRYNFFEKENISKKILAVGRLEPQKNFLELIDIWREFNGVSNGYKLLIAGDGYERSALENKIKISKLQDSIILLGRVTNMDELYKESDFLVMTSVYEGLPLALLEAKAWALPVIAYDCPTGPKEIIKNAQDGYLIKQGDRASFIKKMRLLSTNSELLLTLSKNTKETYKNFDCDKIKEKWCKLIE